MRLRIIYEKRRGACFVPHTALTTVFGRAIRRAGLRPLRTDGFSPRAKVSFGPELPTGVIALAEPADIWIESAPVPESVEALNGQMPDGFRIVSGAALPDDAPPISRTCRAARYRVWVMPPAHDAEELAFHLRQQYGFFLMNAVVERNSNGFLGGAPRIDFTVAEPAQNGIGVWVRAMIAVGAVQGWQDLRIVRLELQGAQPRRK
ncbi:MAG: TIGR03936 family radical SAM-associated protein [Synergistaceae bacterium]|jgi:hypothetical protein|nr:TIGR03936 family radical SAM-associated protein [Synergistaceae bacterium]